MYDGHDRERQLPHPALKQLADRVNATLDVSTTKKRPVEDGFEVLSNVENDPKWSSVTREAKQTAPGPIGVAQRRASSASSSAECP